MVPEEVPFHNSASMPELRVDLSVVTASLQPASPMDVTLPPSKRNLTLSPPGMPSCHRYLSASYPSFKAPWLTKVSQTWQPFHGLKLQEITFPTL